MEITIQATDLKATNKLKKFVRNHVDKLKSLNEQIIEGRVSLKIDNNASDENVVCEIKLAIPGNDLYASKHGRSAEESIMKSVEALKHQLERIKTNRDNKRGNSDLPESLGIS